MIPILYYGGESSFTSNGICRLSDIISCTVEEERNGIYECEFQYPVTGNHYSEIQLGRIISCTHDENGDRQPFIIYERSEPINGVVTFNAHHISYRLNHVVVKPFSAANASLAITALKNNIITDSNFTFWTDKSTAAVFSITSPRSVRNVLGGQEGSFLDVYGGEYEFDKFQVKFHQARGSNNGATIRYGKNLTNYQRTVSREGIYSAIIPYWHNAETDTSIYGGLIIASSVPFVEDIWTDHNGEPIVDSSSNYFEFYYPDIIPIAYDFSDQFDEQPTTAQLNALAQTYLSTYNPYVASENFVIDFVQLWQTEEYASYAPLQKVKLCDTVTVVFPDMGINASVKVIKTVYNSLLERYDKIELGSPSKTYNEIILESTQGAIEAKVNSEAEKTYIARENAITNATAQLTGQNGDSHILFTLNANGGLEEMFIMDTNDPNTATKVWRFNSSGWGYSGTGLAGPYTLAATQNGQLVADFITTGTLQGYGDDNYWDLVSGYLCAENGRIGEFEFVNRGLEYRVGTYSDYGVARITGAFLYYGQETWSDWDPNPEIQSGTHTIIHSDGTFGLETFDRSVSTTIWYDAVRFYSDGQFGFDMKGANNTIILGYGYYDDRATSNVDWSINGDFYVSYGHTKNKLFDTEDYADRLLYSYETASPMYGDIGEGQIGDDGRCYVWLDPIFAETIDTKNYQVFLQAYGDGKAYVAERHPGYFVVEGTAGLEFGWELKAKQKDLDPVRLAQASTKYTVIKTDYGTMAERHLEEIKKERGLSA